VGNEAHMMTTWFRWHRNLIFFLFWWRCGESNSGPRTAP